MKLFRGTILALSGLLILLFGGLVVADREDERGLFRALGNLTEVVHLIRGNYVDEVNLTELEHGLERGLVESVDSAAWLVDDPDAVAEWEGRAPGYGLVLARRLGAAAVRQALPGSPGELAGLEPGAIIERIGEHKTRLMALWEVRRLLIERFTAGETVRLTVFETDVENRREVTLEGADWEPTGVSASVHGGVQVLEVWALPSGVSEAIANRLEVGERPVIIDARDLCWGLEREAVAVADLFAEDGLLAEWRGRRAEGRPFRASANADGEPPIVLVGGGTEGVGEVLAAALRRAGGTLVGQRTNGHAVHMGLVKQDGVSLFMPIGVWVGADDEPIGDDGVSPDEVVEPTEGEAEDAALQRAIELALEGHAQAA